MTAAVEWRPIPRAAGYEAGADGRIRRTATGRILSGRPHSRGYVTVDISITGKKTTKTVHRLVCEAFHGAPGGRQANHLNGVKADNRPVNLEWCTASENMRHSYRLGLHWAPGASSPMAAGFRAALAAGRHPVDFRQFGAIDRAIVAEVSRYQLLKRRTPRDRQRLRAALLPYIRAAQS